VNTTVRQTTLSLVALGILSACNWDAEKSEDRVANVQQALPRGAICAVGTACVVSVTTPHSVPFQAVAIGTYDSLDLEHDARVTSPVGPSILTNFEAAPSEPGILLKSLASAGTAYSNSSIELLTRATLTGDAFAPVVTLSGGTVSGQVNLNQVLTPPNTRTVTLTFPTSTAKDVIVNASTTTALAPGRYGDVRVHANGRLQLSTGTYYLEGLWATNGSTIELSDAQGPIYVDTRIAFDLAGSIVPASGTGDAILNIIDVGTLPAHLNSDFHGAVIAPSADLHIGGTPSAHHRGQFFAKDVQVKAGVEVRFDPANGLGQLLCGTAPPPTEALVTALPQTCESASRCCVNPGALVQLPASGGTLEVTTSNACVFGGGGSDKITGCDMDGSTIVGAGGNDAISVGPGTIVYGGAGNDTIDTLGNSIIFGNDGDDAIAATAGNNFVTPGPGKDTVITGSGNDVVIISDECEITAGEVLTLGGGNDVVISPVDRAGLQALGVTLEGVEEVRVERHSCRSACRTPPTCNGVGTCVEGATSASPLTCDCPPLTQGPNCEQAKVPTYTPTIPPPMNGVPPGSENVAARSFYDWLWTSRIGDAAAARNQLRFVRASPALRNAFVSMARKIVNGPNLTLGLGAIDTIAFLQCRECETVLREVLERSMPTTGTPTYSEHGFPRGTDQETTAIQLKSAAANGLAYQGTKASKSFLLAAMTTAPSSVRRAIAHALSAAYGESIRSELLARLPANERLEAYVFPNGASNFGQRLSAFLAAKGTP
jgi:hypothetical protein